MHIFSWLKDSFDYLFGGMARIFGPNKDAYPASGVQPYEGDPYSSSWI
ncbi:MAG: hypothetical protein AAF821_14505 [Cyanobacteria bacterium P01_D01_bin.156]